MLTKGRGGARPGAGRRPGAISAKKRELQELARTHTVKALNSLVAIATKGESEAARVSASIAILDRGYGRPHQSVAHSGSIETNSTDGLAKLTHLVDSAAAAIEAEDDTPTTH